MTFRERRSAEGAEKQPRPPDPVPPSTEAVVFLAAAARLEGDANGRVAAINTRRSIAARWMPEKEATAPCPTCGEPLLLGYASGMCGACSTTVMNLVAIEDSMHAVQALREKAAKPVPPPPRPSPLTQGNNGRGK